nr:uncharacterized protein LOC109184133 isoform X2 [Ipomoea trifida]
MPSRLSIHLGKGIPNSVEAKLDRILTSDAWCDLYPNARASSVVVSKSDHLPLFLEIILSTNPSHRNRFRFENLWLRDTTSREIMNESWARSRGSHLIDRVERQDPQGITSFREAQAQYLRALHHQNDYWRQREKQFWLREGDTNSAYFHSSVRRRRQNNQISKLRDDDVNWVERGTNLDSLI